MVEHEHSTSESNESLSPNLSEGSSDVKELQLENLENELEKGKSSSESESTDSKKRRVEVKQIKEGVWKSYYHCLIAILMTNIIHYWNLRWYDEPEHSGAVMLVIHFMLIMVFVHLPISYVEIFLAHYTKQPPINLWKVCPIIIGYCYSIMAYSILQSWLDTVYCGRNLFYLIETIFEQAPWLRCPPELSKECLVVTRKTKLSMGCKSVENNTRIWCPDRGTFDFSAQLWFKSRFTIVPNEPSAHLDAQWKLVLCSIAHWIIVMLSVLRTIYKFGKTIYALSIALLIFGAVHMMYILYNMNVTALMRIAFRPPKLEDFINGKLWAIAYISTLWRGNVTVPPLTMTFISRVDSKFNVGWCAITVTFASFFLMLLKTTSRGGLLRLIAKRLNVEPQLLFLNNASSSLVMMPQYLGTLPMPLMWTFYWFAVRYLLLWLQSTMVVEAILENIFSKHNIRKEFRIYFIGLYCIIGCIVNVTIIVKQTAMALMSVVYARIILAGIALLPLVQAIFIFLIYGLSVFVNDIHFTFGSPPSLFWRFCWKTLPFTLLTLYLTTLSGELNARFPVLGTPLMLLGGAMMAIIPVFALKQVMSAIYNENIAYILNPVFDWGPPDKEMRKARKRFNPKIDVRSQPERTVDYIKPASLERNDSIE